MGYNTDFEGAMTLTPELTTAQTNIINKFCEQRHGGNMDVHEGMPGFWCNWETDGTKLFWNGAEKSYDMPEWLELLIEEFFSGWGVKVTGKMLAQGERREDRWTMEVGEDQKIGIKRVQFEDLGITY